MVYNEVFMVFILKHAYKTAFKTLDKGLLEFVGPYGLTSISYFVAKELKKIHTGEVYYYAYFMLIFLFINVTNIHNIFYK